MKWPDALIGSGLSALGLDPAGRWGGGVRFFLYDVVKITVLLRKAVKPKLLALFIAICTAGIILTGYCFNALQEIIL